jgi:hypothetical protein
LEHSSLLGIQGNESEWGGQYHQFSHAVELMIFGVISVVAAGRLIDQFSAVVNKRGKRGTT